MEFPYVKVLDFPKHQTRARLLPWMKVGIFSPQNHDNIIYPLGLVDSGSDLTILDREIGENLGYKIEKGRKVEIKGLGGGSVTGFIHKVGLIVEDQSDPQNFIKYSDNVAFIKSVFPNSYPQQTAIFGTVGFFNHLAVTFIFPEKIVVDRLFPPTLRNAKRS